MRVAHCLCFSYRFSYWGSIHLPLQAIDREYDLAKAPATHVCHKRRPVRGWCFISFSYIGHPTNRSMLTDRIAPGRSRYTARAYGFNCHMHAFQTAAIARDELTWPYAARITAIAGTFILSIFLASRRSFPSSSFLRKVKQTEDELVFTKTSQRTHFERVFERRIP